MSVTSQVIVERQPPGRSRPADSRIASLDALRGLVMILMALDHVRDFLHTGAMSFSPEDLTRTTPALFLTRWITHFCAPVFFFTAGTGAYFWLAKGHTKAQLSRFLLTRGLWLIVLELTVVRFALMFGLLNGPLIITILWGIGFAMIALAALVYLPIRWLAAVSIGTIVLHNLLDTIPAARFGGFAWIWNELHQVGMFPLGKLPVVISYPLIPWFAVLAAGYCFGEVMKKDPVERRRIMQRLGFAMIVAFLILRAINVYGDPQKWTASVPGMTVLSFLRCTKYPPSLDFLLMTLGPALLVLNVLDRFTFSLRNPLIVFGRVPLFYFLVHLFLIHLIAIPLAIWRYGTAAFLGNPAPSMGGSAAAYPPHYGYELSAVYLLWITVVVLLYPLCVWFSGVKHRNRSWWLSYL